MLVAVNISKSFSKKVVFNNLSFSIKKGEIKVVVGASGRGKSTLLRVFCGLERVDSGTIKIEGKSLVEEGIYVGIKEQKEILASVGIVFQNFNLFPNLKVIKNLEIVKKDVERAEMLLKRFGLFQQRFCYPNSLSGGEKQRLAIIRALMIDPKIILFDEPTSALDFKNCDEVLKLILELKQEGYTIVVVTHDLKFVEMLKCPVFDLNELE